jgi:hypothetical protein
MLLEPRAVPEPVPVDMTGPVLMTMLELVESVVEEEELALELLEPGVELETVDDVVATPNFSAGAIAYLVVLSVALTA